MRDHRKLDIFKSADVLVIRIYQVTKPFPKEELYGLVSQMRRASVSVATNIVEGCGRRTETEFNRFLDIAFGSVRELGYLIDLSARLGYLDEDDTKQLGETYRQCAGALGAFIQKRETF